MRSSFGWGGSRETQRVVGDAEASRPRDRHVQGPLETAPGENIALGRQYNVVDLNLDGRLDLIAPSELGLWVFFNEGYK